MALVSFRILGLLSIAVDGAEVPIHASKQRAMLAALLLRAGEAVPGLALVDALWGPAPPASADHLVQVYVSGLRSRLREKGLESRLVTEPAGYRFDVKDGELDARTFAELLERATAEPAEQAASTLTDALALWRGDSLADVPLEGAARDEAARLDDLRTSAVERRVDALLSSGRAPPVTELEQLHARFPHRERLAYQLMLALYRSGRQVDALRVYRDTRRRLVVAHGLEPGPELRELEAAILRQDPSLLPPLRRDGEAVGRRRVPRVAVAVTAFIAAAGTFAVAVGLRSGHSAPHVKPAAEGVTVVDESTGALLASRHLSGAPGAIAYAGALLAIGDGADRTIELVEPRTLALRRSIGVPDRPRALAAEGSLIWIGYGYTGRIGWYDLRTGFLSRESSVTPHAVGAAALAPTARGVWVATQDGVLVRLSPSSFRIRSETRTGPFSQLVPGYGMVWGIRFRGNDLAQVSATTGRLRSTIPLLGHPTFVAAADGSIWVSTTTPNRIYRLDASGSELWFIPLGQAPGAIEVGKSDIWVVSGDQLLHIDPHSRDLISSVNLGRQIQGITSDGHGRLFVTTS